MLKSKMGAMPAMFLPYVLIGWTLCVKGSGGGIRDIFSGNSKVTYSRCHPHCRYLLFRMSNIWNDRDGEIEIHVQYEQNGYESRQLVEIFIYLKKQNA